MADYDQPKQSFTDDYTNGDYTAEEEGVQYQQNGTAPPVTPDGEKAQQSDDDVVMVDHDDQEEIDVELGEYEDGQEEDNDEFMKGDMYEYEVGAINCLWKPSRPQGLRDFLYRCGGWIALNREQIFSGITGEFSFFVWSHGIPQL